MKLDKRFVLAAAFVMGIGIGAVACSDSDSDGDNGGNNNTQTCDKKAEDCTKDGKKLDKDKCECVKEEKQKDPNCGNGKLDDGEVCDIVDGVEAFVDGKGTCEAWAAENDETLDTSAEQGKPGCSSDCKAHSKKQKSGNGCVTAAAALCGNGKIDDGEKCDKDADGNIIFAASETDHSCKATYGKGSGDFADGGVPSCAKDCNGYGKGTCEPAGGTSDDDVNGVVSCEATITVDDAHKATGSAKVTTAKKKVPKGQIICAIDTSDIAAVLNSIKDKLIDGTADGDAFAIANAEFDGSVFKDAGEYSCAYYIQVESGSGVVCKDNKPVVASGSIADLGIAKFSVAGSGDEGSVIAAWTTFDAETNKAIEADGAAPNSGSDKAAMLKFKVQDGKAISVKLGQDAAGSTTALSLDANGNETAWGTEANMSSNSYLAIASTELASATGAKLVLKVNTKGNTIAVTSVKDSKEDVIKDKIKTDGFNDQEIAVPDATQEIHIYNIEGKKAVAFDDIVLKK